MWVSPQAAKTNALAQKGKGRLEYCAQYGIDPDTDKLATCMCAEWGDDVAAKCSGDLRPVLWRDPFSDDPKGLFFLCEEHDGYYGNPTEGFFTCDGCGEVFIENYTWELYYVVDECEIFCMKCYAENYIANEENWINLRDPSVIDSVDFDQIRVAKHIFPVECQDYMGLEFVGNTEFDSMSGGNLPGSGGVDEIKDLLRKAREAGHDQALLVLDGAYQFSVSIGVYTREKE